MLLIINNRDSEKFRKFIIQDFRQSIKDDLQKNESNYLWGIHKSEVKKEIWDKIQSGDSILMGLKDADFELNAIISKKVEDSELAQRLWPEELTSKQITHFLYFDRIEKDRIPMSKYITNDLIFPGMYETKTTEIKTLEIPQEIEKVITQTKSEVFRFVRDSEPVKKLKKLYQNRCQICGYTFEFKKGEFYSEVHHYNPLHEGGNDDTDNMIVVCPTHHAEFDYKVIVIGQDRKSIINREGRIVNSITFNPEHKLSLKNIQSQLGGYNEV